MELTALFFGDSNTYYKRVTFKRSQSRKNNERDKVMEKAIKDASDLNLTDRDINLLEIINEEDLTSFTFEGLKRRLKMHPETLSRILYKLAEQEIVKKGEKGYALTSKAKKILQSTFSNTTNPSLPLLQTYLPPQIPIKKIISNLKGKWFNQLRWLGQSITNNGITLKWITADGGKIISAFFSHGKLHIEAKMITENDINNALYASHQLMSYITKLISKTEHN